MADQVYEEVALSELLKDYLRKPEGLVELNNSWKSALYSLKKSGYFYHKKYQTYADLCTAYKELKAGSFLAGISFLTCDNIKEVKYKVPEKVHSFDEDGNGKLEVKEELVEITEYSGTCFFKIALNLVFSFKSSAADHYLAFPDDVKDFLCQHVWGSLSQLDIFKLEKNITGYRVSFSNFEATDEWIEKMKMNPQNRHFLWDSWDYNIPSGLQPEYKLESPEANIIDNDKELREICGCSYVELCKIIQANTLTLKGTHLEDAYKKMSIPLAGFEQKLASYLLEHGFIVSLEPSIFFPDPSADNFREPDLLVFQKGRVIAIEIDDRSHLLKEAIGRKGKLYVQDANIEKWERDRFLDRLFLMNGIPVLRIWYEEVDKQPETVMTYILNLFDSLGGGRMMYK